MNDDMINDLKQFIVATVHQEISGVEQKIDKLDKKLSSKIDDLQTSVAEALSAVRQFKPLLKAA